MQLVSLPLFGDQNSKMESLHRESETSQASWSFASVRERVSEIFSQAMAYLSSFLSNIASLVRTYTGNKDSENLDFTLSTFNPGEDEIINAFEDKDYDTDAEEFDPDKISFYPIYRQGIYKS